MASYLRPRRGKKSTAETQNIVLKRGEIFMEAPDTGVGTGAGRIKIGDGTTAYTSLPYFFDYSNFISDLSNATVTFTETSITDNDTLLSTIASGAKVNIITAAVKNMLSNLNTSINDINSNLFDTVIALNANYRGVAYDSVTGITVSTAAQFQAWRQWTGIADGSYSNIRLGDSLLIEEGGKSTRWMVAGFNIYNRRGSSTILSTNNVVLISAGAYLGGTGTSSQIFRMNDTNTSEGGYIASEMYTTTLPAIATRLTAIMGTNLKTREILISSSWDNSITSNYNASKQGTTNGWSWVECKVSLPTIFEFGISSPYCSIYETGVNNTMLPVYYYRPANSISRTNFWTNTIAYTGRYILVNQSGRVSAANATDTYSIKPIICVD